MLLVLFTGPHALISAARCLCARLPELNSAYVCMHACGAVQVQVQLSVRQ
jgi:hypothetical protein